MKEILFFFKNLKYEYTHRWYVYMGPCAPYVSKKDKYKKHIYRGSKKNAKEFAKKIPMRKYC